MSSEEFECHTYIFLNTLGSLKRKSIFKFLRYIMRKNVFLCNGIQIRKDKERMKSNNSKKW